jgi:DNA-binding MarR family transcriptional regulator
MSTRLTKSGVALVDSDSLRLAHAANELSEALLQYLSDGLTERGYEVATPGTLRFLGTLDCGENHASEIARMMGVSRQMVARNVAHFCRLGYLEQREGGGRQKTILFTGLGERLMADARRLLAGLDRELRAEVGTRALSRTVARLETLRDAVAAAAHAETPHCRDGET